MNSINLNSRMPYTPEQAKMRRLASEAEQNIRSTDAQFRGLDETPADLFKDNTDKVFVSENNPAVMPKTLMDKVRDTAKDDVEKAEGPKKMTAGWSEHDDKGILSTDIQVAYGSGAPKSYTLERSRDGERKIFMGPTNNGQYVLAEQNSKTGTLYMEVMDTPDQGRFQMLEKGIIDHGPMANKRAEGEAPPTLGQALKNMATADQTTWSGNYRDGVEQRTQMLKDAGKAASNIFRGLFGK
jgi:hypothetical protein